MATCVQILSFRRNLKWYKRWLMPHPLKKINLFGKIRLYVLHYLFNKQEIKKLITLSKKQTEEEKLIDYYFFAYNKYYNNPTYDNKKNLELYEFMLKTYRESMRVKHSNN